MERKMIVMRVPIIWMYEKLPKVLFVLQNFKLKDFKISNFPNFCKKCKNSCLEITSAPPTFQISKFLIFCHKKSALELKNQQDHLTKEGIYKAFEDSSVLGGIPESKNSAKQAGPTIKKTSLSSLCLIDCYVQPNEKEKLIVIISYACVVMCVVHETLRSS